MTLEHGKFNNMESSADMTRPINKMDPRYIAACIAEQPTLSDPQEVEIIRITKKEVMATPLAIDMVRDTRSVVKEYWRDLYAYRHDKSYVHAKNQEGVAEVARIIDAKIVSGEERLQELDKGRPFLLSANHLGFWKLAGLSPEELKELGFNGSHPIEDIHYPHIPFYAPLYPVAKLLRDDIYMAAEEEPGTLGELYRATGSIDVPPASVLQETKEGTGRILLLTDLTRQLFEEYPNSALTVFPEGGTTGKRNGGKTGELGKFHVGVFAIASNLEVPIVLLAHHFNPTRGFQIAVVDVVHLEKNIGRQEVGEAADRAQKITQTAFDHLRKS